ncbi:funZ protein [Neisseria sp. Dent CA1/247]|uniref:P-loop ATPase, Sll1717 family n=1 Tax=Neisseria sp. Dent CA1/247 TaxID=2912675 RepID=UPI001FD44EE9|nr:funZ protein [Neisseria sp. Dent CA1/247]UOO77770.1 funZ protein [Neisseria sp. Dent CA1/247]
MKKIQQLQTGYIDAKNYSQRDHKEFFNQIFVKGDLLDSLCKSNVSFLIGEKGTGKTAYATYLSNNEYKNIRATTKFIKATDYSKFLKLKQDKHLQLSNFEDIWKVIIYLLISRQIRDIEKSMFNSYKFKTLNECIDKYYLDAFKPEILQAINVVEDSKGFAELMCKDYAKAGIESSKELSFTEQKFNLNLNYIQRKFEEALSQLKLDKNHILFIDGVDIRPDEIPFIEYQECIKGLANAIWWLNTEFFSNIRDSKGRIRVVLLIRPDIFNSLRLHNANAKLSDNSVFLDWRTDYKDFRTSRIFSIFDHFLRVQQSTDKDLSMGQSWDYYFQWQANNLHDPTLYQQNTSFISFLRNSYYRPRDILKMIGLLKGNSTSIDFFQESDFLDSRFQRNYSNYLLGEIKDHLLFYYSEDDYNNFLKFFEFLNGSTEFSYDNYEKSFNKLIEYLESTSIQKPQFMTSSNEFLQFLFDLNVISYIEETSDQKKHIHWCFKDREYANISPKVKTGLTYQVFYGLTKALNLGKTFKDNR